MPSNTVFERALERFREGLTKEQEKQFQVSSLDQVHAEIQDIQSRLGSAKKLRSLNRLSKFLGAMTEIEQLVKIFLNVSEVVAFVWGPIKLALMMARAHVETLECLLDTYVEVGEIIPGLRQYDALFGAAPFVLEVLEKYFCDILEFHRSALDVFARPSWKNCFDSTWKIFKTRFKPIVESLKRHRALLLDERLNAAVLEIQRSRDQTADLLAESSGQSTSHFNRLDERIKEVYAGLSSQIYDIRESSKTEKAIQQPVIRSQEMNSIINKLDPPHFEEDQYSALHSCHPKSGEWLFQTPTYQTWSQSTALPDSVLFIHGMPGAGKTLLASRIISHLRPLAGAACLFFYFKRSDDTKSSMSKMLRVFLVQLIQQDHSLAPGLYQSCCLVSNADARQLSTLKNWVIELLKSQSTCAIVLDGLDECNHHGSGNEAKTILDWLLTTVIPVCERGGSRLRLLALGQRDGVVDSTLSAYPSIRLDTSIAHFDDIQSFAKSHAWEISKRFSLDEKEGSEIVRKVTTTAKGMFLYAKVVMDNLMAQGSNVELDQELQVNFPSGLDQAYERVAFRVLDSPSRHKTRKEAAAKILRWLACAVRPLKWNEIQSLFCIDPHQEYCNPRNMRLDNCKSICGSFVDIEPNPMITNDHWLQNTPVLINLVHDTARQYLIQARRVDLFEDNARMAILSSAYLASSPFHHAIHNEDILSNAVTGYYGLQDYMVSSWQNHLSLSLEPGTRLCLETTKSLQVTLHTLLQRLGLNFVCEPSVENLETLRGRLEENGFEDCAKRLEQISSTIRKVTEKIQLSELDAKMREIFLSLNGRPQYKCPKPKCLRFSDGFENQNARDHHVAQHYIQFLCSVDGCPRQGIGFTSCLGLEKHTKQAHAIIAGQFDLFPPLNSPADIWSACKTGNVDFVKDYYEKGGDLQVTIQRPMPSPKGGITLIVLAARYGHLNLCQYLVSRGCGAFQVRNKSTPDNSAFGEAIKSGNKELFHVFLNSATDGEMEEFINGRTLEKHIAAAINSGEREMLDTLLKFRSKRRDPIPFVDIFYSASNFKPSVMSRIDASGLYEYFFKMATTEEASKVLTQSRTDDENNLHRACSSKNQNAVSFLLRHMESKDIFAKNKYGNTPFWNAVRSHAVGCVACFFEYDLARSLDTCDSKNGPLHVACRQTDVEMVKLLLPFSITSLNDQNYDGDTPLHLCILRTDAWQAQSSAIIKTLLETGLVDFSIRNSKGQTVFDVSSSSEVLSLLHAANQQGKVPETPNDRANSEESSQAGQSPTGSAVHYSRSDPETSS
ncbi:hypothetical protein F4803DRAFT_527373 [Xylaria telfairii]|nr:hypothetical protein F4803DRAFT_527373 [Xylaria telfairii]